jgi:predicted MFS family arabinose efflux permease
MSAGAFVGSRVFAAWGFGGVCVMGAVAAACALGVRLWPEEDRAAR